MKNNIKNIVLVGEDSKSLEVAIAVLQELIPGVDISTFESTEEALTELGGEVPFYDIVMPETKMKKTYYGRMVTIQAWLCATPAVIVRRGEGGNIQVGYSLRDSVGSIHDVEVWKEAVKLIL